MGHITYCLICLGTAVKMYPMNSAMTRIYNELISNPSTRNLTQMYACYECAYLLHKYDNFKIKCRKAYNILCYLSTESIEVTENLLSSIDRKKNKLTTALTSQTMTYDYHPIEQEFEADEVVKSDPITFDNKAIYNEDDPLQEMQMQEMHLETENISEHIEHGQELLKIKVCPDDAEDHEPNSNQDYQQLGVKNTLEHDIVDDCQFIHTFQVESSNYKSDTGSMLWLTIQSKENTEFCDNKPPLGSPIRLDQESFDSNNAMLNNYIIIDETKIKEEKLTNEIRTDSNKTVKKIALDNNQNRNPEAKILKNMTIIELTPEETQKEFLLRKKSSNYIHNTYKCDLCYRGFNSNTSYQSHLKKHSLKYGAFQCDICKLCYINELKLKKHHGRMHKRKFSCNSCTYTCFNQSQVKAHISSHTDKKYTCKICEMTYRYRNSLLTHMQLKHSVECVCDFCGGSFASERGLVHHKNLIHRQEENEHLGPRCDECDVHFASELAWKRHRVLCSRHQVQFGCKVCGDVFEDSGSLRAHSREHEPNDYRMRRQFLAKKCPFCKIRLPDKTALKNHLMTVHPNEDTENLDKPNKDKSYVCEFCGKAFSHFSILVYHQKVHSNEMPYSCSDCGMRTKYKVSLDMHRRTHTEEYVDKFQCDLCGRAFSDKCRLVRHMKGHMGIFPYKCVACDKSFLFRCEQRVHYKHVHDKQPYPKKKESKRTLKKVTRARIKIFDNIRCVSQKSCQERATRMNN